MNTSNRTWVGGDFSPMLCFSLSNASHPILFRITGIDKEDIYELVFHVKFFQRTKCLGQRTKEINLWPCSGVMAQAYQDS